ncbi:MAG: DNA polymerase Y family protein [Chitinophagaceae bacterium]
MPKRFLSIWFRHLKTDWFTLKRPDLLTIPFVLTTPIHGRLVITSANLLAQVQGVHTGMVAADARAIIPTLMVLDDKPELSEKLLKGLAKWCNRYAPLVSMDPPDGLFLDISGCPHLWGGEKPYLHEIINRLKGLGYLVRAAIADTIGTAWAIARFGNGSPIIEPGQQAAALLSLPPAALRLQTGILERFHKLGFRQVSNFISMPRSALRRRFGQQLIRQLDQALGAQEEAMLPVFPIAPYQERLPCLEPIVTSGGIEIALQRLLETLCLRLQQEQKGLRTACFKGYRVDGKIESIEIGTSRPSYNAEHLSKLFENKLATIEPALGIELFMLEAIKVEEISSMQATLWNGNCGLADSGLSELIDRLENKMGLGKIHRYLPDEHYWPERSFKLASSIQETPTTAWRFDKPRPMQLLSVPEHIDVTAPIPDYPPMLFRYKGKLHKIVKADGPERIEQEWWLEEGQHRDYYCVENEEGFRYWVFRLGHYSGDKSYSWFLHGFFS